MPFGELQEEPKYKTLFAAAIIVLFCSMLLANVTLKLWKTVTVSGTDMIYYSQEKISRTKVMLFGLILNILIASAQHPIKLMSTVCLYALLCYANHGYRR